LFSLITILDVEIESCATLSYSARTLGEKSKKEVLAVVKIFGDQQKGSYLLELSLVSFGIAVCIVGIGDIANILRARDAVRTAVAEGMRCVIPSASRCTELLRNPDFYPTPEPRFDVSVTAGWDIPRVAFKAEAEWRMRRDLEAHVQDVQVNTITVQSPRFQYQPGDLSFIPQGHATYFVEESHLPVVRGPDPFNQEYLDPTTLQPISPAKALGGTSFVRVGGEVGNKREFVGGSFQVGNVFLNRNDPDAQRALSELLQRGIIPRCYNTSPRTSDQHVPNTCLVPAREAVEGSVSPLHDNDQFRVPVTLVIDGASQVTSGEGSITVTMEWNEGSERHVEDLKGRIFSNGNASLVPRGLDWRRILNREAFDSYKEEIASHGILTTVPENTEVTLRFTVTKLARDPVDEIAWRATNIRIFYPTYRLVDDTIQCGESPDPHVCVHPSPPIDVSYVEKKLSSSSLKFNPSGPKTTCDALPPDKTHGQLDRIVSEIASAINGNTWNGNREVWIEVGTCDATRSIVTCQHPPSALKFVGCKGDLVDEESVLKSCFGDRSVPDRSTIEDFTTSYQASSTRSVQFSRCSPDTVPACAAAQEIGRQVESANGMVCGNSPSNFVEFQFGPFVANRCSDQATEIAQRFRQQFKIPSSAEVHIENLDAPRLRVLEQPDDPCIPYFRSNTFGICGSNVSRSEVDRCCERSRSLGGECSVTSRRERVGDGRRLADSDRINFANAVLRARGTLDVLAPNVLNAGCDEGTLSCSDVSFAFSDQGSGSNRRIKGRVLIHLPLRLAAWFGKKYSTIEFEDDQIPERELALQ